MTEWQTLLPSPIHASRIARKSTPRSHSVKKSARAWHGCSKSDSPLMTGTLAWRASPVIVACEFTRAMMPSTHRERLRATSGTDSRVPSPISRPTRWTARPPSWMMPTSKVTRVRSEALSKISAKVLPASGDSRRPAFRRCFRSAARANSSSAASRVKSAADRKCRTSGASEHGLDDPQRLLALALGDDEGRRQPEDLLSRRQHQEPGLAARVDDRPGRHRQLGADEQAAAAHDLHLRVRSLDGPEPVHQIAAALGGLLPELAVEHGGHGGQRDRGDERRPAEGRSMGSRYQDAGDILARQHGADRHAVGKRFRERHDVRLDPVVLIGPEPPGPRDAGLDLVDDEERARLVAELAQPAQVVVVGQVHAALALDAFHDDASGAVVDRALHRAQVVVGHVLEAGHQGLKAVLVLLLAGRRQGREGAPVERVAGGHELDAVRRDPLACILAGDLERRLVGLGAGVREEHAVGERMLDEQLGQVDLRRRVIEVGDVQERRRRLLDGAGHSWMAVPQRGDRDARAEVQVLAALRVPDAHAVASHENDRGAAAVVGSVVLRRPFQERLGVHRRRPHRTISVPIPSRVKSSSRIACGWLPSMLWAFAMPPSRARSEDSTLGSMPPSITPSLTSRSASLRASVLISLRSESRMPWTSVRWISFSAPRAAAMSPATRSALML